MIETTIDTCKKLEFSKLHVFPYSERKGTASSSMEGKLDNKTNPIDNRKDKNFNYYYEMIWRDLDVNI